MSSWWVPPRLDPASNESIGGLPNGDAVNTIHDGGLFRFPIRMGEADAGTMKVEFRGSDLDA